MMGDRSPLREPDNLGNAACTMVDPDTVYTQAAETVIAQFTELAGTNQPAAPGNTPITTLTSFPSAPTEIPTETATTNP